MPTTTGCYGVTLKLHLICLAPIYSMQFCFFRVSSSVDISAKNKNMGHVIYDRRCVIKTKSFIIVFGEIKKLH